MSALIAKKINALAHSVHTEEYHPFFINIMWHFISDQISQTLNSEFICDTARQVHQQHFHRAFILKGSQRRFFVKVIEEPQSLELTPTPLASEQQGLDAINQINAIKAPQVICGGSCFERETEYAYLVMQYIAFKPPTSQLWEMAGQQLAEHHKSSIKYAHECLQGQFGWTSNNVIGSTPQINTPMSNWADFFVQNRLLDLAKQHTAMNELFTDDIISTIHRTLTCHTPEPCVLHGDLWSGNIGFDAKQPIVFDPAVWIGDRECDLAIAALFGGFAQSFFTQYQSHWPLPDGASQRQLIYQLHPIMNHALMFGGGYWDQLKSQLAKIRQH